MAIKPVYMHQLPIPSSLTTQVHYDDETHEFVWRYENGTGLSIIGNNMSEWREPVENIVFDLVNEVRGIRHEIEELKKGLLDAKDNLAALQSQPNAKEE